MSDNNNKEIEKKSLIILLYSGIILLSVIFILILLWLIKETESTNNQQYLSISIIAVEIVISFIIVMFIKDIIKLKKPKSNNLENSLSSPKNKLDIQIKGENKNDINVDYIKTYAISNIEPIYETSRVTRSFEEESTFTKEFNNLSFYKINDEEKASRPISEKLFYMPLPDTDGSFDIAYASDEFKIGASVYRFKQLNNSNEAKFAIEERDASIRLALVSPFNNINPVCEALNRIENSVRSIITKQEGVAILKGNKWILQAKAKIEYVS